VSVVRSEKMTKQEMVLAALAPGAEHRYTPVQVQKLMFLIDRQIPELVNGPHFNFQPYHYGPFDRTVYQELDRLADFDFVDVHELGSVRTYALTASGARAADRAFRLLDPHAQDFVSRTSQFVRSLNFSALVSAIYKKFPEMRANSVFQA
jgi:uncharacterized protein